jgi:hypothetical protein
MKFITSLLTALLLAPCGAVREYNFTENKTTILTPGQDSLLSLPVDKSKFKYFDLQSFLMDTIAWDRRRYFYTRVDRASFYQIYQDTSLPYNGGHDEEIDQDFFYSLQQGKHGLIELAILSQREGQYCDRIMYLIYDDRGRLLSSFRVAGSCGDGGYYGTAYGRFVNDSTYVLSSEDNYTTEDVDGDSITIQQFEQTTTIKPDGTIIQNDSIIRTEVRLNR